MNLIAVMQRFPDQTSCIEYLERIRWQGEASCPHCDSKDVTRKKESGEGRIGRWLCNGCGASFKVTSGTVFHGTKIALQKWFLAICLIGNAKKSLSSHQLSRDLDLNQKTAWYLMTRVRTEMAKKEKNLLKGIIEADETYIGENRVKKIKRKIENRLKEDAGQIKTLLLESLNAGGKLSRNLRKI